MALEPAGLSKAASAEIRRAGLEDGVAISAITAWELALLAAAGRIDFRGSLLEFVRETTALTIVLPLTADIAASAVTLPASMPKDTADRLIVATALVEGIALVTKDRKIRQSGLVKTIW